MSEIITVNNDNVERHGFFCRMSARDSQAWRDKRDWLAARFDEGLQMRLLGGGERGFIEFIPGAYAWRAIDAAQDFVVIHCLWIVGRSKGQGFGSMLLDEAENWARANGFRGVASLTGSSNWLIGRKLLERRGYVSVERISPGGYHLMVREFSPGPMPRLSGNWEQKARALGPGLTVLRTAQCPYLGPAADHARAAAAQFGLPFSDHFIHSAEELRHVSPTPYGVYALVRDGKVISTHHLREEHLVKRLQAGQD